jgi:putative addiction module component (TIGR02574 family)
MTERATQLLAEAMKLPEGERGDLAARLLESLDPTTDADIESAWGKEIEERVKELREGKVKPLTWSEARQRILDDTDDGDPA